MNTESNAIPKVSQKGKKYLWYGWQKDAALHFGINSTRTIENYRRAKGRGPAVQMKRKKLIEFCRNWLIELGIYSEPEISEKINEAFGEC